jgi:MoaA/NifB/PqqE/SkfB family radical SAM enzyme
VIGFKKVSPLKRICFSVTNSCNLRCRMCDIPVSYGHTENLPLELIKTTLKEAAELGVQKLDLTGGEAMLRKDIYDIISYAASLGIEVFMASNGILIGEAQIDKLIASGLSNIAFSLEGPEELHDFIRGKGTYEKTLNVVKGFLRNTSKKPGFKVVVGIVLSKYNYNILLPFSKFILEEVGVTEISIQPFQRSMLSEKSLKEREDEFVIKPEMMTDFNKAMEMLMEYSEKMPGRLPKPSRINKYKDYFMGEKIIPPGGCNVPAWFCGIDATGFVYPCWKMSIVGNIREKSFARIFNSKERKKQIKLAQKGICSGCLDSCFYELY